MDLKKDANLNPVIANALRRMERENQQRVHNMLRLRRRNRLTGGLLGLTVVSIYVYSMAAVKQERLFDDFEEANKA